MKSFSLVLVSLAIVAFSCGRRNSDPTPNQPVSEADQTRIEQTQHSADEGAVQSELDDALSSVNSFIETTTNRINSGRVEDISNWRCGLSIDSTNLSSGEYRFTYDGTTNCNGRVRSGSFTIKLTSGTRWADRNSVVRITYDNLQVKRGVNGVERTYTIQGWHQITNSSGGLAINASSTNNINHRLRGELRITFDNEAGQRRWVVARRRVWSRDNDQLRLTISGDTTLPNRTNVETIGVNRFGTTFNTAITTPIVVTEACGWYRPISGERSHSVNNRVTTALFGLNAQGERVSGTNCASHYRLTTGSQNAVNFSVLVPYF